MPHREDILAEIGAHTNLSRAEGAKELESECPEAQERDSLLKCSSIKSQSTPGDSKLHGPSRSLLVKLVCVESPHTKRTALQRKLKSTRYCGVSEVKEIPRVKKESAELNGNQLLPQIHLVAL